MEGQNMTEMMIEEQKDILCILIDNNFTIEECERLIDVMDDQNVDVEEAAYKIIDERKTLVS